MAKGHAMNLGRALRFLLMSALFVATAVHASGPRWVTGAPYFYAPGYPIIWYTDSPQYFTDSGDLSQYVNHAAADAIVQAAAGVWNIQTSRLTLAYGGVLDEHIDSSNTYPGSTGIVFPMDVQASNYLAKQIAVIYDSDGSITDILLGAGASNPSGCRQNAVTESVDSFGADGRIRHAVLVLNGRCTGQAPEQQLQLQYQLMRAFGRVLGLGWSQTNDNVFTGNPRPTYQQALYWPVMHPIDVICGPYTYQCMPNPFTLRDDDISGLDLLYPVGWSVPPGKTMTLARANQVQGNITFPNGQGMQGVNIVVHRLEPFWNNPEEWESVSGVSGYLFRHSNASPVSAHLSTAPTSGMGATDPSLEGAFNIYRIPLYDWEPWQNLVISTQPINPLYTGAYAVGPYETNAVQPSGSTNTQTAYVIGPIGTYQYANAINDAAGPCNTSADGSEYAPSPAVPSGWWTGNLCSYGHSAWTQFTVKPGRTFTVEVTAEDEYVQATTSKMLPVIGLWNSLDNIRTIPSIAAASTAFNSAVNGMTTLTVQPGTGSQPYSLRMAIADQRGDGRPDYGYQARILYADSIVPASVPAFGGAVTITGMGFRPGNTVSVNGVAAAVSGWTANTITAVVPSLHATTAMTAAVTIRDLVSGATTMMNGALNYAAPQPTLVLLSGPAGQVFTSSTANVPFAVQLLQGDGVTPIAGTAINLSLTAGEARFDACGGNSCVLSTDAQGRVATAITPLAPGLITLSAAGSGSTVTASFTAVARIQSLTALSPNIYVAAGAYVDWQLQVLAADNAVSVAGVPVQWTAIAGAVSPAITAIDAGALAQTVARIGPLTASATATITACAWTAVCADFSAQGVSPDEWAIQVISDSGQSVAGGIALGPLVLRVVDSAGHPVVGAPIEVHQTLEPWSGPCPDIGRCPIAPVYNKASSTLVSAMDGTVTLAPLDLARQPIICNIVAASGTQGFISMVLQRLP
jgi:hypothetical protein